MNKYLQKIFKALKIIGITLLLVFLAIYFLIQVPKVQTWLVDQVSKSLTETLQTKVRVKKVNLDFFKTAVLEGIYIEDQKSDTLLFAEKLKANIGIFSLFQKEIFLNKIQLEGAVVNLSKEPSNSLFNFQFIIDAFSSDTPKVKKENTSAWTFGIGQVVVASTRFSMVDKNNGGFDLKTAVGNMVIDAIKLDFVNKKIALSDFNLEKSSVAYIISKNDKIKVADSTALFFPAIGWEILVDDIQLKDNRFKLSNFNYERQADIVDYNFLNFENISLKANDFSLNDTSIIANIKQASLLDHSGFQLKNMSAEIGLDNKKIVLEKVKIETPNTSLKSNIRFSFNEFGDLSDFMEKVKLEADIVTSQIAYRDITKLVAVLKTLPVVKTDIDEKIDLNGKIILEKNNISFENFDSKIGEIFLLQANGSILNLTSDPLFDLNIKNLKTDYASFSFLTKDISLPEGLAKMGKIDFSGQIKGTINDLKGKDLNLVTESTTQYKGDLNILGLPDIENTVFKAKVDGLTTRLSDIQAISGAQLPPILDSLGIIKFQGDYEGTIYKFLVNGDFQSDAGDMSADLNMDFDKDYQNARYDGNIELSDFDLSKIMVGPFGLSSLNVDAKGSGLNINDLDLTVTGKVPTFEYQDYTYHDLSLSGVFFKKRFEGIAKAEDKNLHFDFRGMIDLNDSLPDFQLALEVDTINLHALNLYGKNLGFSGNLEADLKGNKLDNINGTASLKKFNITQDSIYYSTDKIISLKAESPAFDQKAIHFRSEFMDANIVGQFNVVDFPQAIVDFIDGFFPIEDLVLKDSTAQKLRKPKEQNVAFDFTFKEIAPFAQIFLPDFSEADTAFIKGKFNSTAKQLSIDGAFPHLTYGNFGVDTFRISSNGTPKHLETIISLNQVRSSNSVNLPFLELYTLFANDTLNFGLNILEKEQNKNSLFIDSLAYSVVDTSLEIKGNISFENEIYALSFLPEFILNNYVWKIEASNKIEFTSGDLTISNLDFLKESQKIAINSFDTASIGDIKPIEIRISDFNLEELSKMLGMSENSIGGMVNGNLILKEPKNNLHYNTEIFIDSLSFNDQIVGNVDIQAKQENQVEYIDLSIKLDGESQLSVVGNYEIKNQLFDLDFQFGRLPLFLIDPFLTGILKDSDGFVTGEMKLKGPLNHLDANGSLTLNNFSTTSVISNMKYRAENSTVQISEKEVTLGTIRLIDTKNNDAVLSGRILHNYFQDIRFDLNFNTDSFQFLNTTLAENDLYYGDLFLKALVEITGNPELPVIKIDASTLPNTQLIVRPFSGEEIIKQENYIIYGNPASYNEDSIRIVEQRIVGNRSPFDLSLKLQVTKDAKLNIIIDPETGDQLISVGTANLILNISPSGIMTVAGNYTIDNGSYSLNYEQLVKRDFDINKGSSINFSGDPMNATFNVTASYKVRASTYELLSNQSTLSDTEILAARVRTDVIVLMKLRGNLNNPEISFDIQIPENNSAGVSSAVNRKLAELRLNPQELNKQAFGLLLFKSFISETNSSQTLSNAGSAMALSSVGNLISDQLNNFANRYIQGFEVNFGVESYNTSGDQSQNVTKMEMSVSKNLFHDRLTIQVGTNVNLASDNASSATDSGYSGIAGDFVLEYKLSTSGNYLIKVFHKSDYNVLEQNNAYNTGAGIIFRKSFNSKKFKE